MVMKKARMIIDILMVTALPVLMAYSLIGENMGHAKEIVTLDVYADKRNIISDGIPEIEAYMKEVLPNEEDKKKALDDIGSICVDTSEYI